MQQAIARRRASNKPLESLRELEQIARAALSAAPGAFDGPVGARFCKTATDSSDQDSYALTFLANGALGIARALRGRWDVEAGALSMKLEMSATRPHRRSGPARSGSPPAPSWPRAGTSRAVAPRPPRSGCSRAHPRLRQRLAPRRAAGELLVARGAPRVAHAARFLGHAQALVGAGGRVHRRRGRRAVFHDVPAPEDEEVVAILRKGRCAGPPPCSSAAAWASRGVPGRLLAARGSVDPRGLKKGTGGVCAL